MPLLATLALALSASPAFAEPPRICTTNFRKPSCGTLRTKPRAWKGRYEPSERIVFPPWPQG